MRNSTKAGTAHSARGLRITGGTLTGRRLRTPRSGLRPSSDRVRESLFARIPLLADCAVLDLYAGSGALGIEALSRGARTLVAVDRANGSLSVLRENFASLGLDRAVRIFGCDVVAALHRLSAEKESFDLVLLDPPYASGEAERALTALAGSDLLAADALVVLERARRSTCPQVEGLALLDERRYGETVITRFQRVAGVVSPGEHHTGKGLPG